MMHANDGSPITAPAETEGAGEDSGARKKRKRLGDLITAENVGAMQRFVAMAFDSPGSPCPSSTHADSATGQEGKGDDQEKERVAKVYAQASALLSRVALTYLHQRDPLTFKTLLYSVVRCTREAIATGERVEFRIVRPRRGDSFWSAVGNVHVLSLYERLLHDLEPLWRQAKSAPLSGIMSTGVSRTGRYGTSQKEGTAQRKATIKARAQALLDVAAEILDDEVVKAGPLDREEVVRWIRAEETMAPTVQKFLGHLLGKERRTIKQMLSRARKTGHEANQHGATLDRQGWLRLDGE